MHAKRGWVGLAIGAIAGAALTASMPLAASDPPAKEKHKQGLQTQPAGAHGGRWHDAQATAHGGGHGGEAAHDGHSSGPEIGFRGCAFFDNAGFSGRRGEIRDGVSVEWLGRGWSDRISSAACHPGCRMIGYVDINYGGARRNFSGAVSDLGAGWNDRISALRAVCDSAATPEAH